jgi:hypothetical protein
VFLLVAVTGLATSVPEVLGQHFQTSTNRPALFFCNQALMVECFPLLPDAEFESSNVLKF